MMDDKQRVREVVMLQTVRRFAVQAILPIGCKKVALKQL